MMFPDPPVESHTLCGLPVYVVRDDLCSPFPGPNFSKVRGVYARLRHLAEEGTTTVSSQDTGISRVGWGVSWLCRQLGLRHINVYAQRQDINFYQRMSRAWGGELLPVHGSFSSAMRAQADKAITPLADSYTALPIGLSMPETLWEHADLMRRLDSRLFSGTVVVVASSGTIAASLLYAMGVIGATGDLFVIQSSTFSNRERKIETLVHSALAQGAPMHSSPKLILRTPGWKYTESFPEPPPFPSDIYLDRKAWAWLWGNVRALRPPITFWNVGGEWHPERGLVRGLKGDGLTSARKVEAWLAFNDPIAKTATS